jgi:hypothetical protein
MFSSKKTLIIRSYTSNEYIQSSRFMRFVFKEIIVLWEYSSTVR